MADALWEQARARNWYVRIPQLRGIGAGRPNKYTAVGGLMALAVIGLGIGASQLGSGPLTFGRVLVIGVPAIAVLAVLRTWTVTMSRGKRSAAGRAVTDQLIGFRAYLATAEAKQLRFGDSEDIFSNYLPWAIAFGLANRWQRICEELVEAGRLTADPAWYVGPAYYNSQWSASTVSSLVAGSFGLPPITSGGSGGGSSSGFSSVGGSSGGSSGGGGGGGGGGSW